MSKLNPRYHRVPQNQEKDDSDGGEIVTLFDQSDFGEKAYNEDEDLHLRPPCKFRSGTITTKVVPKLIGRLQASWLFRVLMIVVSVLAVLLVVVSLGYAFWGDRLSNSSQSTTEQVDWEKEFFPGYTEASSAVHDMNGDGYKDIIVSQASPRFSQDFAVCPGNPGLCSEVVGFSPCRVQLLAMCGYTGDVVWSKWVDFEGFAIRCSHDFNKDDILDCIVSGLNGIFSVINGANGEILWTVDPSLIYPLYNFYYPLVVDDMDGDGVQDMINIHGGDATYNDEETDRSPGFLVAVSGRTGQKLMERVQVPDGHESYSSPVLYHHPDGTPVVVFGTGGETVSGSLWAVTMDSIRQRVSLYYEAHHEHMDQYVPVVNYTYAFCYNQDQLEKNRPSHLSGIFDNSKKWSTAPQLAKLCPPSWGDRVPIWNTLGLCMYQLTSSDIDGVMLPPVIIDLTGDGKKDLIVSKFGGHTVLLDGTTGKTVWDISLPGTQSYSIPAPIHFNNDNTPDLLLRINKGNVSMYDYSYMGVANGRTGELLWTFNSSQALMTSPISLLNKEQGHDGMVFVAMGPIAKQTERNLKHGVKKRGACARDYVDSEMRTCVAQSEKDRESRHVDDNGNIQGNNPATEPGDISSNTPPPHIVNNMPTIPEDLWIPKAGDTFPDPWNETEAFIQDYCGHSVESITAHLYFLTPQLAIKGDIRPLYSFKPIVYNPLTSPVGIRMKRHSKAPPSSSSNSQTEDRHSLRCAHILLPFMIAATPIIDDLNNDSNIELSVSIQLSFLVDKFATLMANYPPKMVIKTFTLENRFKEVYNDAAAQVDFSSFLSLSQQPWLRYMGSKGNGEYDLPTNH